MKKNSVLKITFLCSDIYPIPVISCIKSFTLTIIKAQEKNLQNTNNLSNLFQGQTQADYLVGPKIILMALCSIFL